METIKINEMFEHAPSSVFRQSSPPPNAPDDFYMESEQVSSAEEDLSAAVGLSVRLTDFGTGKLPLPWLVVVVDFGFDVPFLASWFDKHLTEWIQPQMLRAPEVILGAKWDSSVDIWNLGSVVSNRSLSHA